MAEWVVSVTDRADAATWDRARALAAADGVPCVPRDQIGARPALLVGRDALHLFAGQRWAWHPGMLHALREAGWRHPWAALAGLRPGDRVLDATLGLGTDARFLAELTGARVTAVERVPAIARWTADGLRRVGADVEVVVGDSAAVLAALGDGAVDVVIADPMFPAGGAGAGLDPLRALGDRWRPDAAWLAQARRVARRAVVIKDVHGGDLLEALGCPTIHGRAGRAARYGAWGVP